MSPTTPLGDASARASTASPVRPGDVLAGKYEVERVLGAGGMGVVVAARHKQLKQRVALKFLLPEACQLPGAVERFLREGEAAARITSEHVARVLDTGVLEDGAPYLVLEFLEGRDLGEELEARGRLPWPEAVAFVLQASEALAVAHQMGVIHRDLKPPNLFLTRRADGSPLVKVLDFGISKVTTEGTAQQATSTSAMMGSPRYMSPEQMFSTKSVDVRTDVWALGVILFELVTGRPVWVADTVQGLCALIATAPAPSLLSIVPDLPAELDAVVQRCLAKDRDERIASVADLALALAPLAPPEARMSVERIVRIAGRPLPQEAAPAGLPVQAAPPVDPARAPAHIVGSTSLGAATLPPRRSSGAAPLVAAGVVAIAAATLLVMFVVRSSGGDASVAGRAVHEAVDSGPAASADLADLADDAPVPERDAPIVPAPPLPVAVPSAASPEAARPPPAEAAGRPPASAPAARTPVRRSSAPPATAEPRLAKPTVDKAAKPPSVTPANPALSDRK